MPALSEKGRNMKYGGLAWGATNSGKSFSMASHAAFYWATHPGRHLLIGVNLKLLRNEIIPLLRSISHHYGVASTHFRADLGLFTIGKSTIYVIAGASEGSEDRLRSFHNILSMMVEEATALTHTYYDMGLTRLLLPWGPVWVSCNPTGPVNWVKERIDETYAALRGEEGNLVRWPHIERFLVKDNPALTPEQVETFEASFSGTFKKRMIDAEWAAPEGLVYPQWIDEPVETADRLIGETCYVGADYGESNVTCAHYCQRDGDHYVVTGEYYYDVNKQGDRNPAEHAAAAIREAPGRILGAWVDPSAVDLKSELRKAGINTNNAYNASDGYGMTDGMLQRGEMRVVAKRCPELNNQLYSLIYDKHGEKPDIKCIDHGTDDLRYLATGLYAGRRATLGKVVYR